MNHLIRARRRGGLALLLTLYGGLIWLGSQYDDLGDVMALF